MEDQMMARIINAVNTTDCVSYSVSQSDLEIVKPILKLISQSILS